MSKYLPDEIICSNILPYLNILERRGIIKFESKITKQLRYPRDHLSGIAKRLCSYLNTVKLTEYSDVKLQRNQFIMKNTYFLTKIFLHRYNYSTFSYFYFENQIHILDDQCKSVQQHITRLVDKYNVQIKIICQTNTLYALSLSNRCPIGYYSEADINYLGPRQLFRILHKFNKDLEIDLKHSMKDTKCQIKQK